MEKTEPNVRVKLDVDGKIIIVFTNKIEALKLDIDSTIRLIAELNKYILLANNAIITKQIVCVLDKLREDVAMEVESLVGVIINDSPTSPPPPPTIH